MTSEAMTVYQLQCLLGYLGCGPGAVDGVSGPKTRAALLRFQQSHGLAGTGECDAQTAQALRKAVAEEHDWWQGIRHFRREEFRCKCGGRYCSGFPAQMQQAVVQIADAAREHFGSPGHVVSGLRCREWNAHEGGVVNSQHMYGEAIDLRIEGVEAEQLRQFVSSQPGHRYSYCINGTNVHFDIQPVGR